MKYVADAVIVGGADVPSRKSIEARENSERSNKEQIEREWEAAVNEIKALCEMPFSKLSGEERNAVEYVRLKSGETTLLKDAFIELRVEEFERNRDIEVSGKYRDDLRTSNAHKKAFVELSRIINPAQWRELTSLSSLFKAAVTNTWWSNDLAIESRMLRGLVVADQLLENEIASFVRKLGALLEPQHIDIQVRTKWSQNPDFQFKWGIIKEILYLAYLKQLPDHADSRHNKFLHLTQQAIKERLMISRVCDDGSGHEFADLEAILPKIAEWVVTFILACESHSVKRCCSELSTMIKSDEESVVNSLLELIVRLIFWAEENCLSKDWLIRYALWFLDTATREEGGDPMVADVPFLQGRSLETETFYFQFKPWFPGEESKEDYESRLDEAFMAAKRRFFRDNGQRLSLDRSKAGGAKSVTKPGDPEFESLRWLIAWNEGATYRQIAEVFFKEEQSIRNGIGRLKIYELPIRKGKPGRPKSPKVSLDRVREIRAFEI